MMLVLFILLASAASYKPVPPVKCGVNEYAVPCKTICPPQNCDIAYTPYKCDPNPTCIPGCDCIDGYLRNDEKICVHHEKCPGLPEDLPIIGLNYSSTTNAVADVDPSQSNSSTSLSSFASSSSSSQSSSFSLSSPYAFMNGIGGGVKPNCTYNSCTPTCSLPYSPNCPEDSNPCNCPPGTIISEEGGKCVPVEECPKYANCNGDYNATYTDCPFINPSTCDNPDAEFSNTSCGTLGCKCNPGHLLTQIDGTCIKPEDCPGGRPCSQNETFLDCLIKCPNNYCPTNDSRDDVVCEPEYRCPSGCGCLKNFKRKSLNDSTCILTSDCPPVNCTRPNEKWNSCPEPCFSDLCSERNKVMKPGDCPYSKVDCNPQCVCLPGFYRNGTGICVTPKECPPEDLILKDKVSSGTREQYNKLNN